MPNKKLAFLSYCCIASTADLWRSRLASYTEFSVGERNRWRCAYRYCYRYKASSMEKNRSICIKDFIRLFSSLLSRRLYVRRKRCVDVKV